jgi:hypothetical protein
MKNLIDIVAKCRNRLSLENRRFNKLWGQACKCGRLYEEHDFFNDLCPRQDASQLCTKFTVEDRMTLDAAWFDAHSRICLWEIPITSGRGVVDHLYCLKPIKASTDPSIEYCDKHVISMSDVVS